MHRHWRCDSRGDMPIKSQIARFRSAIGTSIPQRFGEVLATRFGDFKLLAICDLEHVVPHLLWGSVMMSACCQGDGSLTRDLATIALLQDLF